jgi:phosphate transport system substrate-binding protein
MQRVRIKGATMAGATLAVVALSLAACSSSSSSSSAKSSSSPSSGSTAKLSGTLNGSGSTFQLTFQQTAIQSFKSIQSGLTVNYSGVGSGTGRSNLAAGTVNYAGSDSTIPASELSTFNGKTVLYFPVVIGPITVSYNLSGLSKPLNLSAPVIADIFEAKVTTWNNSAIAADNPGVTLPSTAISICRRSDSSGTTQNFSEFLVKGAPSVWTLGSSSTINWPAASRGGNGNGGVASCIKSTAGAVGYVDYADAKASALTFASVKNSAGDYVAPSVSSATTAADNATIAPNLTFSAIWASGAGSYPITYQSWDLVYEAQSSSTTAANLKGWLGYLLGDGQKLLPELNYAPLPASLDQKAAAQLSKIGSSATPAPSSS